MILPEYQRKGLGKWLTKHCNCISDEVGAKTYVTVRYTSKSMFEGLGFKEIATYDTHAERWGGDEEKSHYRIMRRDPQGMEKRENGTK